MNIILLSGGSGKRLWPLSNEIRSKQFLPLFKDENGNEESMVQRVYRQIKMADEHADVTIATSRSQVSALHNQLGDKISVCIEPCRRDTFPAIVLASVYLHDVKKLSDKSCVIVCPVDPYVDNSYYEAVRKLEDYVENGDADLTLMGIEPTYPSEKYGYIIPKTADKVSVVKEFKEKPDVQTAKKYLAQGALWNAGVFAFRLSYLLHIAHQIIDFQDYDDLLKKYESLEKISFDYAVVEKADRIQVIRYEGEWKDVGTWNTMTEVMDDPYKGNVTIDDTCENTNIVNELNIPVLCMGCRNMVIAVSNDGILVSDKERSGYMKSYVEDIAENVMYAEKSWGTYTVVDVQENAVTVKLTLQKDHQMTYHSHKLRDEVWTVLSGEGIVYMDGNQWKVGPGDTINLDAGCRHSIRAESDMTMIEVQIGEHIEQKDKQIYPCAE